MLNEERISQLLDPYVEGQLPAGVANQISTYINKLLEWNRRINLTAIREPEEIARRHFGESLFAARMLLVPEGSLREMGGSAAATFDKSELARAQESRSAQAASVIDVGSGAGFPGMVLKLYAPAIRLKLIESQGKKATFLREVARSLRLRDVTVVQERAEHLAASVKTAAEKSVREERRANLVTLRAVEKFADVLPVAASLLLPGGTLGALIGVGQADQAEKILAGSWRTLAVPESTNRVLAIWRSAPAAALA